MCHYLGLPVTLQFYVQGCSAFAWSDDVYRKMHRYQVARGFDPHTIDFAQSLGYPAYKPIQNDSDRFEEIDGVEVRDPVSLGPSPPSIPYRSQMPDESDDDTDVDSDLDRNDDCDDWLGYWSDDERSPEVHDLCVRFGSLVLG
ncbi:hypothetical protein V5O48_015686 [Marasmius crinis-equi]|uniref:Uncharacterized protein n=1 Tax=Marasmius crinis-equi TaxID=585013 RepID=A0ABR3ETW7_9AGAR